MSVDLRRYIESQLAWSMRTFGEGSRSEGICKHIEKELEEIRQDPESLYEWADVVILALDGAWRAGYTPEEIEIALYNKQQKNFSRKWPESSKEDQPTEHIRDEE